MATTINNFISALAAPHNSMATLKDIEVELSDAGAPASSRTKHFVDARIAWHGKRYMLSMPLSDEALTLAQRAAVKLRLLRSPILLEYKILPREMSVMNSQGRLLEVDLLLEEIPSGAPLSSFTSAETALCLFDAIDDLEHEFKRLSLTHSNLKAENIIVGEDFKLYPLRLHYVEVGGAPRDSFDSLRNTVALAAGLDTPQDCSAEPHNRHGEHNPMLGYSYVGNPFEGLCVVRNTEGLYGYIDSEGAEQIAPRYLWAANMREGRAEVETEQGMGLIDIKGDYIVEPNNQIVEFDPDRVVVRVKRNNEWTTLDYEGQPLEIPLEVQ